MRETQVRSLGCEDPLEKEMEPTPVLLPGKFHGWRKLIGYSLWGHKELDTTERLHLHFSTETALITDNLRKFRPQIPTLILLELSSTFSLLLFSTMHSSKRSGVSLADPALSLLLVPCHLLSTRKTLVAQCLNFSSILTPFESVLFQFYGFAYYSNVDSLDLYLQPETLP